MYIIQMIYSSKKNIWKAYRNLQMQAYVTGVCIKKMLEIIFFLKQT